MTSPTDPVPQAGAVVQATAQAPMLGFEATLVERQVLRYTPGGVAVLELTLSHSSVRIEAGRPRDVAFEIAAVVLGDLVERVAGFDLGAGLSVEGFLAPARKGSKLLKLHITGVDRIGRQASSDH
ncbi:MAG: primosomal replication protein N [Lautropia sp.]